MLMDVTRKNLPNIAKDFGEIALQQWNKFARYSREWILVGFID